jgi:hypothetical protein
MPIKTLTIRVESSSDGGVTATATGEQNSGAHISSSYHAATSGILSRLAGDSAYYNTITIPFATLLCSHTGGQFELCVAEFSKTDKIKITASLKRSVDTLSSKTHIISRGRMAIVATTDGTNNTGGRFSQQFVYERQ